MRKKIVKSLLAATLIITIMGTTVAYATEIQSLKDGKKQVQQDIDSTEDQLAYLLLQMDEIEADLDELNTKITEVNEQLKVENENLDNQYEDMKLRIKYMYEDKNSSIAEAFLTSKDMSEAINKSEYIQQVYSYDRDKLEEMSQTAKKIEDLKTSLEEEQTELNSKADELTSKQSLLYTTLEKLKSDEADYESKIVAAQNRAAEQAAKNNAGKIPMNANNDSAVASSIVALAYSLCGVPYVYGGSSPSGFDCSGFTSYCFKQNGIYIARTASAQSVGGQRINGLSNALPGDLIFYPGHVGIYIGNGQIIHAPHSGDVVKVASANIMTITGIRRYW